MGPTGIEPVAHVQELTAARQLVKPFDNLMPRELGSGPSPQVRPGRSCLGRGLAVRVPSIPKGKEPSSGPWIFSETKHWSGTDPRDFSQCPSPRPFSQDV